MTLQLYAHPFSSYCQKVLTALYENSVPFTFRMLEPSEKRNLVEFARLSPMRRMPVLVDGERVVLESSIIIEYLGLYHPGPVRLIPEDAKAALEVRMLDRAFDNYVMGQMQKFVFDRIRAEDARDPTGVQEAVGMLDRAYAWLDRVVAGRAWAAGDEFSMADCAAAPSLFYADWVHPIPHELANLRDYRRRLLARPSFARAVDEARPYRAFFPPGAPDRD
jgi:glutathione S-transferase